MPISLVQSASKQVTGASSTTISLPSNVTAGNCVVVFSASWFNNSSTVTDGLSNSYTSLVTGDNGGVSPFVRILAAYNASGGALTATVNFTGSADASIIIAEFSGVAAATASESANTATGTSASPTVSTSATTTDAGDVIVGIVTHAGATNTITEAGLLIAEQENNSTSQAGNAQYTLPGTIGTQSLNWTMSTSEFWLAAIVALKPGASDVTVTPSPATCAAVSVAPLAVLSSITIAPAPTACALVTIAPAVQLGGVTIQPAAVSANAVTVAPNAVQSSVTAAPNAATCVVATVAPAVVQSSIAIAPAMAACASVTAAPTVVLMGVTIAPNAASASVVTMALSVVLGTITHTPVAASASSATQAPAVVAGSIAIAPEVASASAVTVAPTVIISGGVVNVTPAPADTSLTTVALAVVQTSLAFAPQPATTQSVAQAPSVTLSGLTLQPAQASVSTVTIAPDVTLSTIVFSAIASVAASTPLPTVVIETGGITVLPNPAMCTAETHAPGVAFITPPQHITPASGIGARGGFHVGGRRAGANTGARRRS